MDLKNLPKFENDKKLVRRFGFLMEEWRRAYDRVDLQHEIQYAHAWLLSSAKRYTDMSRFLNNWLKSAQRRALEGKPNLVIHKHYAEQKPDDSEVMTGSDWAKMKGAIRASRLPIQSQPE